MDRSFISVTQACESPANALCDIGFVDVEPLAPANASQIADSLVCVSLSWMPGILKSFSRLGR